jgi:hypothetical protein
MSTMTDAELAKFLGIDDDPRWPRAIAKLDPAKRASYERMADVCHELALYDAGLGPRPVGVLIDSDRSTRRRKGWR